MKGKVTKESVVIKHKYINRKQLGKKVGLGEMGKPPILPISFYNWEVF
jgi:hypothetical protein